MKHEITEYGMPFVLPDCITSIAILLCHTVSIPNCTSQENLKNVKLTPEIEYINNKIYQACFITYGAVDDPTNELFRLPAVGVYFLVPESERRKGEAIMRRLEVYIDGSPIFGRIAEIAKAKAEREASAAKGVSE